MIATPAGVAKNTIYLTSAYVMQKVFSFLYFILIARSLGVADIGKYVFALSFTTIFGIFIDWGFSSVLTREGAKDFSQSERQLGNVLSVKLALSAIIYGVVFVAINLLGKEPLVRQLVYLSGAIMILDSFSLTFYAVFRAFRNLKYEALGIVIGQILIFIFGAVALMAKLPLHFLIAAILCGSLFNFAYSWILLRLKLKIKPRFLFNRQEFTTLLKIALPFAIAGIFARVYGSLDTVLLSTLAGDKAVGWYSAGYKITFALQFLPMAIAAAVYPAMANYFVTSKENLAKTFERSMYYLLVIALPITFGVLTLANQFITMMYGAAFLPTALALKILIVSLVFNFLGFPLGSLLNACNRQTTNTINLGITMVVNALLNVILIPLFGEQAYLGAAIAALAGGVLLFTLSLYWADKIVVYDKKFLLIGFFKVGLSSLTMAVVILACREFLSVFVLIPLGALIYFAALYALGGFNFTEIKSWLALFKKSEPKAE